MADHKTRANHLISYRHWATYQGKEVFLFRIQQENGSFAEFTNYGATLVTVVVPDRFGEMGNVILGFDSFEGYLQDRCYIGSTVGRFANRISNAGFVLDGETFVLEKNDGNHTNHGGLNGFHNQVFNFDILNHEIRFTLHSQDGEGGYPGNLDFTVNYSFSSNNQLCIQYSAQTDRKTIVNFTSHAYFNLNSKTTGIAEHQLRIAADTILEADADYLPTGQIIPAGDITFKGQEIEKCLAAAGLNGINTFYIFDARNPDEKVAALSDPVSGRKLEVYTSYPGLMLYTGDYLSSILPGHQTLPYQPFDGLCLECQSFPDSPNHTHFPSTVLNPGEQYQQYIYFKFSTDPEPADLK